MVRNMETTFILIGIIIILILIIILLISNKNTKIIISSKNDKELSLDEKHKELLKNLNIDNSKGPIKTSKITTQITTKKNNIQKW